MGMFGLAAGLAKGIGKGTFTVGKGLTTKVVAPATKGAFKLVGWGAGKAAKNLVERPMKTLAVGGGVFATANSFGDRLAQHGALRNAVNYRYF